MEPIDVVFSFDTTGSMYPCLGEVRRTVSKTVKDLFKDIPRLRVGAIAHGDYCDAPPAGPYVIKMLDLTSDEDAVIRFINGVQPTGGGDEPECYELVLAEARRFSWAAGKNKALVMIGDATPHPASYALNTRKLDWRNELDLLQEARISVYGVQALNRSYATAFWQEVAKKTGGFHLQLNQFRHVVDLLKAICYKQESPERLIEYRDLVQREGRMNREGATMFGTLTGRATEVSFGSSDLKAVAPGRFQIFDVMRDQDIMGFCKDTGATFKVGRGFYEFGRKSVEVQHHKEVILEDKRSGDLFTGEKARELLGLPKDHTVTLSPKSTKLKDYNVFIQSTSANRKLLAGTRFLYEVD
jgi:hypothetical protein